MAQENTAQSASAFRLGLMASFGTHFQRIGVNLGFYFHQGQFQSNTELRAYYNFRAPGPSGKYPELLASQGLVFGYGPPAAYNNPFYTSVSNQTGYAHCLGYSYNAWFNKAVTTQQTGIVHVSVFDVSFITENDILARPSLDRFRTGAFLIQYQYKDQLQVGLNCAIWTGQYGKKVSPADPNGLCYMDTTGGRFTDVSYGLLSVQVKGMLPFDQVAQMNAGIDADQVRDVIQNKTVHTLFRKKNCQMPLRSRDGALFLNPGIQSMRAVKPYLNLHSNPNLFY